MLNRCLWILGVALVFMLWWLNRPSQAFDGATVMSVLARGPHPLSDGERHALGMWLLTDCLFVVTYTVFFVCLCRKAVLAASGRWKNFGRRLTWFVACAAVFDWSENKIQWDTFNGANGLAWALPILGILKWIGPILAIGYFVSVHRQRVAILRVGAGAFILLLLIVLSARAFFGNVALFMPAGPPLDEVTHDGIRADLECTIGALAEKNKNPANAYDRFAGNLAASAGWISNSFRANGYSETNIANAIFHFPANDFPFPALVRTNAATNVIAEKKGMSSTNGIIIIGAHYDTMTYSRDWTGVHRDKFEPTEQGTPGANDNASGVAALLELSLLLKPAEMKRTVRFVAFANEEPPFFESTNAMGSYIYAERCARSNEPIIMMISLDALALYNSTNSHSWKRAGLKGRAASFWGLPDRTDYVAFMSNWTAGSGVHAKEWAEAFARHSSIAVRTASLPFVTGEYFAWSDDWSFTRHGYPAFTITDTAFYRSPRYHEKFDSAENLSDKDYDAFATVVYGLSQMIREMADK